MVLGQRSIRIRLVQAEIQHANLKAHMACLLGPRVSTSRRRAAILDEIWVFWLLDTFLGQFMPQGQQFTPQTQQFVALQDFQPIHEDSTAKAHFQLSVA
jgi:hypothetical protein